MSRTPPRRPRRLKMVGMARAYHQRRKPPKRRPSKLPRNLTRVRRRMARRTARRSLNRRLQIKSPVSFVSKLMLRRRNKQPKMLRCSRAITTTSSEKSIP